MRLLNAVRQWTEVYFTTNNSERSRRNAAHHYDIGNDLYEPSSTLKCCIPVPSSLTMLRVTTRQNATSLR